MNKLLILLLIQLSCFFSATTTAAMQHDGMSMDEKGMVMNENFDKLPKDCKKISGDVHITVRAGQEHARKFNGKMYAFDQQEWNVEPCSRIRVTFINDDDIRHQFMLHGLPGYLYPKGMFTIEVNGPGEKEATFIVPSQKKTYFIHCELPRHMETGMKAQLKVGGGDGDLPSIPGISDPVTADWYAVNWNNLSWLILLIAIVAGTAISSLLTRFGTGNKSKIE